MEGNMGWFKSWMQENETTLEVEQYFKQVKLIKKFTFGKISTYVFEAKLDGKLLFPIVSWGGKYMFKNAFEELLCFGLGAKINAYVLIQVLKQSNPALTEELNNIEKEIGLPDKFKGLEYDIFYEPHHAGHFCKLVLTPQTSA